MGEFDGEVPTQIRALPFVGGDRVLVADADLYRRTWLREAVGNLIAIEEVTTARDALERLTADPPRIFVVGATLVDAAGGVLLEHAARQGLVGAHRGGPVVFLIADSLETTAAVDEQAIPIYYRLTPTLQPERLRDLFGHALARGVPRPPARPIGEDTTIRALAVIEQSRRLGEQRDVKGAAAVAVAAIIELVRADRARCLYYDDDSGALWSETDDTGESEQASAGIAGFSARAGVPAVLERAAADPVYAPRVDDPEGTGEERLAVLPVVDRDLRVHAVLIAIREPTNPPFTQSEANTLAELAASWAPFIHQLAAEAEAIAADTGTSEDMFRQEAIQHMIRQGHKGDVVRVHPGWINGAFWLVIATVAAGAAFVALARVHQYTDGPSVVRVTGRTDLIAYDGGSVTSIEVSVGQAVVENQVLLRLHDTEQANKMRGLEAEFERKLVAYLQSPADPKVKESLSALVAERDSAKANLEARVIRAPHDGVVRDVFVGNGQRVEPGKIVVSVARKDVPEGLSVIAFLPGADRPRLHAGQLLRMRLPGYRGADVEAEVRAISSEVIGAAEAKARYLANQLSDAVPIQGSVVVVEALLPKTFVADGQRYELHDGMVGTSEVRLESRTVLETVIPGLHE